MILHIAHCFLISDLCKKAAFRGRPLFIAFKVVKGVGSLVEDFGCVIIKFTLSPFKAPWYYIDLP